jgi:hypothetical protein
MEGKRTKHATEVLWGEIERKFHKGMTTEVLLKEIEQKFHKNNTQQKLYKEKQNTQ